MPSDRNERVYIERTANFEASMDPITGRPIITLMHARTGEVIAQLPMATLSTLDLVAHLGRGLFVNQYS